MKFVFLGTTGYHPNNRRHTPSIMFPEIGLILDAGTGFFRARDLIQTNQLHVFLSHIHLDHCFGLTFLFDIGFEKNLQPTKVYVDSEKIDVLNKHFFHELLFPAQLPLEFSPISDAKTGSHQFLLPNETKLTTFPLKHPGGAVGFVIEQDGKTVAYVTDTTASLDEPYLQYIQNVDVLIHECYFPDGEEEKAELTGHSCATPVAKVAKECNVGELLLVHVNPLNESDDPIGIENVRKVFRNARIPSDFDTVDL